MASMADIFFFPIAAVILTAFVILTITIIPKAEVNMRTAASSQTAQFEVQSMMSTMFHGYSYKAPDETPLTDYQIISYLICGQDFSDPKWKWFDIPLLDQEEIKTGVPSKASYYEVYINRPSEPYCGNQRWTTPGSMAGTRNKQEILQTYQKLIPVMDGDVARVTLRYGFR